MVDDWVWVEVQDPRLKGWEPLFYELPAGSSVTLVSTKETLLSEGAHFRKLLRVDVAIAVPGAPKTAYLWKLLYPAGLRRPTSVAALWATITQSLEGDAEAIREAADAAVTEFEEGRREDLQIIETKASKHLDAIVVGRAAQLTVDFKEMIEAIPADQRVPLMHMIDDAYDLGRQVREAEFPTDLKRSAGYLAGAKRKGAAEEWWLLGSAWAQAMWDNFPAGWPDGRRRSVNGLAAQMYDHWSSRPFDPLGPASVEPQDLAKRVLPKWKAQGLLDLAKSNS